MKKMLIVFVNLLFLGIMVFGQVGPKGVKDVVIENSDIKTLQLAYELADYGYSNESASALLQAAEILAQIPKQPAKVTAKQEGKKGKDANVAKKNFIPNELVKDARKFAGKDKTMLAWADDIEKALKTVTRGASGGALYSASFAYANGGTTYYDWYFDGGRPAEVAVHSMDGADLDLYVYDENGNLIVYDERATEGAYCSFFPKWTGTFRVIIKNNAKYNATFEVYTN